MSQERSQCFLCILLLRDGKAWAFGILEPSDVTITEAPPTLQRKWCVSHGFILCTDDSMAVAVDAEEDIKGLIV